MGRRRADALAGIGSGAAVFAVYLSTLAPGLIDIRDTPAFQYMGRVLGIPHQPGYPFYLLISWAVSQLPVGSLAFRMNLLSAVFGAATVTLVYGVLRHAGCRAAVAAAIATAAGLGPVVWSQCLIAEVYSLETCLIAATLLALLWWRDRRSEASFFGAAFLFGLAVAHHPNDLLLAPAWLAFVWLTDRSWLLDGRRVGAAAIIAASAFLPYAYLIIRTSQQAAYVLEPAHSLADVARVVTGAGYRENVFPFSPEAVLTRRIPLAASLVAQELTWPGCLAAIAGLWSSAKARQPLGAFLALGLAGLLAFVLNYDIPDIAVFFIPVFLLAWIAAGLGVEAAVRVVAQRRPRWAGAVGTACLLAPLVLIADHGREVSLRERVATMRWADALFSQIRSPAVFLEEDWVIDQVVRYKTLGETLPPDRIVNGPSAFEPAAIERWMESRMAVYAFERKAGLLRLMGWPVDRQPVRVSLDEFIESQRPGSIVAVAAPAEQARLMLGAGRGTLRRLGLGSAGEFGLFVAYAGLGVRGASSGGIEVMRPRRAAVQAARGEPIGEGTVAAAPSGISVTATGTEAGILVDGREVLRTARGIAVAVWTPDGHLRDARVVTGQDRATVPYEYRPVFMVRGARRCVTLQPGAPVDVTPLAASGVISLRLTGGDRISLTGGEADLPGMRIIDVTPGVRVSLTTGRAAGGREAVFSSAGSPADAWVLAALGKAPTRMTARWEHKAPGSEGVAACAIDTSGLLNQVDERTVSVGMANDDQAILLGAGWSRAEASPGGPVRLTDGPSSAVLVPLQGGAAWTVRVVAAPEPGADAEPPAMILRVNGQSLGAQPMTGGWQALEWKIPQSAARPVNEFAIVATSRVAVGSFTFVRE
jgi:hypothetical protein